MLLLVFDVSLWDNDVCSFIRNIPEARLLRNKMRKCNTGDKINSAIWAIMAYKTESKNHQ